MNEIVTIASKEVHVVRSDRRQTVGLTIERDGSVVAAAPSRLPLSEVANVVRSREVWLHSALSRRQAIATTTNEKQYVSGEGFYYLGHKYRLRVMQSRDVRSELPELRLFRGIFELRGDCVSRGRDCFIRWYARRAESWLAEQLPRLARRVGVKPNRVIVRDLGFRWASCSHSGGLNFHWRLVLLPSDIAIYLATHELCHLIEHNHSESFWSLIRTLDHDAEHKKRWLQARGGEFDL